VFRGLVNEKLEQYERVKVKRMRNGKIATLPTSIRDELSLRMENGGKGKELLAWLNGLPEVQESIQAAFGGVPISKQNLSEWRQGGFREWHIHYDLTRQAHQLSEYANEIGEAVEAPLLAGRMAAILAARYAALLNPWDGGADPEFEKKLRLLRGLNRDIALLQKTLQQADRHEIEHNRHAEADHEEQAEKMKQVALTPLRARLERRSLEGMFELLVGRSEARRLADFVTSVKFDLPRSKKARARLTGQTRSNRVKPRQSGKGGLTGDPERADDPPLPEEARSGPSGQTQSNPVKPSQSENNGMTGKPESAEGPLETAT
jgi:hypothetical protein